MAVTNELIEELRQVFDKYDVEHKGHIKIGQLFYILCDIGYGPTEAELYQFMNDACDTFNEEIVKFEGFAHVLAPKLATLLNEESLTKAFGVFDRREEGSFNAIDLRTIMASQGEPISEEDSNILMTEIDAYAVGGIRLKAFMDYLLDTRERTSV